MAGFKVFMVLFCVVVCELAAIPIVLKESTPNGESVIAISSSNPEVEKYILELASQHAKNNKQPAVGNRALSQGTVVQSFSVATPDRTIVGTGRSFGDESLNNPFFVPYFTTDIEGFDVGDWLRNLEKFYDPSFAVNGASVSATAVNDNGHVYGKVETVKLDSKDHK